MSSAPARHSLTELNTRLQTRRPELEQAILTRVYNIEDPTEVGEQSYIDGLRRAVSAALDYGFAAIEDGRNRRAPPVPAELLAQARLAARTGVSVDTVLRRYCSGNTLFSDLLIEEAEHADLPRAELKRLLRAQASSFDRLLAIVSEEYSREAATHTHSFEQHRVELLRRLLAGELLDTSDLNYEFDVHHLGIVASGLEAFGALQNLAENLDRRLLIAQLEEQTAWAWLGGRRGFDSSELDLLGSFAWPEQAALACGEPAEGLVGWRLTHRQAAAALPIAQRGDATIVHHADVALLASVLQDDLLAASLRQGYLAPLETHRDGGAAAKSTLRAYLAAGGNVSSAAAALGLNRHTVASRLAAIADRIGRPLDAVSAEIETALRLDALEEP
jgi:PucR-like helix-turn-helix protein